MYTVIYGISNSAKLFIDSSYNKGNNIFACTYGGEKYEDKLAISLEELAKVALTDIERVIICSEFVAEISQSLIAIGFEIEQLFFFDYNQRKPIALKNISLEPVSKKSTLYAFYDLSINLPCYDVTIFCVLAELKRKELGLKHIHFVVVPSRSEQGGHIGSTSYYNRADYQWRIDKILRGCFECITSCAGISVLSHREEADALCKHRHRFPNDYLPNTRSRVLSTTDLPSNKKTDREFCAFSAPNNAQHLVNDFLNIRLNNRKLIVITLREYGSSTERNSNIKAWAQFIQTLDTKKYYVVIIRDSYNCLSAPIAEFVGLEVDYLHAASLDFTLRVALYQSAYVNMNINNGPIFVQNFIEQCRYINFIWVDDNNPAISTSLFEKSKIQIDEHYQFRQHALQHLIWKKDEFSNIKYAFEQFLEQAQHHDLTIKE
jgi:hypothetical protein